MTRCVLIALWFLAISSEVDASCGYADDERLRNFCRLAEYDNKIIPMSVLRTLDYALKREGMFLGVGVIDNTPAEVFTSEFFIRPELQYKNNANGGNSDSPLIVGGFTFIPNPESVEQSALLVGATAGYSFRFIHAERRFFEVGVSALELVGVKKNIGINETNISTCSKNHIDGGIFLDACISKQRVQKQISHDEKLNIDYSISRIGTFAERHQVKAAVTLRDYRTLDYTHKQYLFKLNTILDSSQAINLEVGFGEPVLNKLVLRQHLSARYSLSLYGIPFEINWGKSYLDGSRILGERRRDIFEQFGVVKQFSKCCAVYIGVNKNSSTVSHFSYVEPVINVSFQSWQF